LALGPPFDKLRAEAGLGTRAEGLALMSRVSIADRIKLAWQLPRQYLRHCAGRIAIHPLLCPPLPRRKLDRIVIAPQDLRTADPTRASEIYSGRFAFAGKIVVCDGRSPFEMTAPSNDWAEGLLGFGWLRHLRAADSSITRSNARALVNEWIDLQGSWNSVAWRPDILSRRIIVWLTQAPLILEGADVRFYRRFLRNLTRQIRYLRFCAGNAHKGIPRLQARIALTYASLCMASQGRYLNGATRRLIAEIESQVLPDGGHVSRNPGALIELLLDLLPLSQAFTARNVPPPSALQNAIDRMMPMLRFFRHGDGNFALFNGMGPTSPDLIATILAYDDARGLPIANAPHCGYQRLELGAGVVLIDTGRPPPLEVSGEAHAGCLSFEFSVKHQRIVVNCGLPATGKENWRQHVRGTAAHSTATFNGTSSCQFVETGVLKRLHNTPIAAGPTTVAIEREDHETEVLMRASHDGYASRFGVVHQRILMLHAGGLRLDGEDCFLSAAGRALPAKMPDQFALRFHLHPSIRANRLAEGRGVMLTMPNKDIWHFTAPEDQVEIEESVYLAGTEGPRRTVQIVIYGHARDVSRVLWSFSQMAPPQTGSRRSRSHEPELPL
jgi:uncharacterized heparinase superfamily protein